MNEPTEIPALNGGAKIARRLCVFFLAHLFSSTTDISPLPLTSLLHRSVDYISFSAHVDYTQNSKFIDEVRQFLPLLNTLHSPFLLRRSCLPT